ncbi:DUF2937 family protein [Flexibacterium corallicola]|uniref:DUF2937 family protein n=1 Tax=Flexibacterium corallicola TaxID=3037259 RepID=UPI00286EE9FC|nr:DUF2937 family protein [Pseudovibrio sp. M1P-2-3]
MIRILALLCGIGLAVLASQLPEFSQQYRQRLGGAIDALEEVKRAFMQDAQFLNLSVNEAFVYMSRSPDGFIRKRGESVASALERLEALKKQRADMNGAKPFERIWLFLRAPDIALSKATLHNFEPALPITIEGIISAGLGFILGFFTIRFLGLISRRTKTSR